MENRSFKFKSYILYNCVKNSKMDIYEKKVHYHQFFEDISIIEVDLTHDRVAIVFTGKDQIIHIFDLKPYQKYNFCDIIKDSIEDDENKFNVSSQKFTIFEFPDSATKCIQDSPCLKSNKDNQYNQEFDKYEPIISLKKPKCPTTIKAVLADHSSQIIGLNWIDDTFNINSHSNGITKSKLLFSINSEGYILIYKLKSTLDIKPILNINRLQGNPFSNLPEEWVCNQPFKSPKPVVDYYIDYKNLTLITLQMDNYFMFWKIHLIQSCLNIVPRFEIIMSKDIVYNKLLYSKNDEMLFCFHNLGFDVYKISNLPPFSKLLSININELQNKTKAYKNENDPFICQDSYQVLFSDLVDLSDKQIISDKNYFFSLQKPEFSLDHEYLFIPYYEIYDKVFLLIKIDTGELIKNLKDCFINKKIYNKNIKYNIVKESKFPIFFSLSPSYYYKYNSLDLLRLENKQNLGDLIRTYYQPLLIINEKYLTFYDTKRNLILQSHQIENKKFIDDNFIIIKWISFNKILTTSDRVLFLMFQYYNEFDVLGIEIDPDKIKEELKKYPIK